MTATLTLKPETEEFIQELTEENSYDEESIYEFIDEHGEDNFVKYYEEYVEIGENGSYESVDAFVDEFGLENLGSFEDAYYGSWDSPEDFVESFVNDYCYDLNLPSFVEVDWTATWERNLQYDFTFNNGFVFNRNF